MGKLWDKIKEILFGKKIKALPPGEEETVNCRSERISEFKEGLSNYKTASQINNPYIQYALEQYFEEYLKQINDIPTTGRIPDSYTVLTSINALGGDTNQNVYYENNLLGKLRQERKYTIQEQTKRQTGECVYYHIKSNNYQRPEFSNMIRIYLNCKDEDVANLAQQLLDNNTNPNYYLKFDSTIAMGKRARSEKIVIYTDEEHWEQDTQNIMNVKRLNPELFADSEKMNPFMEQYGDTFCAIRHQETPFFTDLNGNTIKLLSTSSNRCVSQILQDSYKNVVQNIACKDPELGFLLDEANINNYNLYIQNYPYINSRYHEELINGMENNMTTLSMKNKIFINGISNKITEQNIDYDQSQYSDDEYSL